MSASFPMPHRADVNRYVVTADGAGGDTVTTTARIRNMRCFVQPIKAEKRAAMQAAGFEASHNCYTNRSGVDEDDFLTFEGRTLKVKGVRRMDERAGYWHLELLETEHG